MPRCSLCSTNCKVSSANSACVIGVMQHAYSSFKIFIRKLNNFHYSSLPELQLW
jgi:hypothetical protein